MQAFLLVKNFKLATTMAGVEQLIMCARVLGGRAYPDKQANNKPDHREPRSKNISSLRNLGIFQQALPDAFASGSKNKLNLNC